jgi:transcriptional regulator GlxA family with amidase domain
MPPERVVVVVVYDGFALLDLAGPADVFNAASLLGPDRYRLIVASPDGAPVRSTSGVSVTPDASLSTVARGRVDTLMVVGGLGVQEFIGHGRAAPDLRAISRRARRTTSVCTGALALAAAGLLDGFRATTHWASCERLAAAHPDVEVLPDRIYVHDRDRWTSAGVTAAIDLSLALVQEDCGPSVAHTVAGWAARRPARPVSSRFRDGCPTTSGRTCRSRSWRRGPG